MGYVKVITGPTITPLTLNEGKNYLKIDVSTDDDLITDLIKGATEHVEAYLGQKICTQTVEEVFDKVPIVKIEDRWPTLFLTYSPVQSVSYITYTDTNEENQTWDASKYKVDLYRKMARITPAYGEVFPDLLQEINSLTVRYVVGYGNTTGAIPSNIKMAVRLILSDMYHNRSEYVHEKYTASRAILDRVNYNLFI